MAGEESDRGKSSLCDKQDIAIREAANAAYLFGSEEKYRLRKFCGEALAAVMMVPEIGECLQSH